MKETNFFEIIIRFDTWSQNKRKLTKILLLHITIFVSCRTHIDRRITRGVHPVFHSRILIIFNIFRR
jgi:hypothetical protein